MAPGISRRAFCLSAAAPLARPQAAPAARAITRGPRFHWFGYYDKLEFDPAGRYVLANQADFESRSPGPDDVIRVGMVDLEDHDRWIELGETRAWNWQQGCMLQWLPGSKTEVIWNDRQEGRFVAHILDVRTRKRRTLRAPIYALSPDARWAIYPDFRRLNDCRPGYGYAGLPDPNFEKPIPDDAGLWRLDLGAGTSTLLVPFSEAAKVPHKRNPPGPGAKHWFNHLLYNTDGTRFIFLHRWRAPQDKTFSTRMFTASADGRDLYVLDPWGDTSHFVWRDARHVLAWAWHPSLQNKFYLYEDRTENVAAAGGDVMTVNGHCTYLPGNRWILNDTYPDTNRMQNLYLYRVESGTRVALGSFPAPRGYQGEWRCDLHPRSSPDGRKVVIDSAHAGGRQMYLVDISGAVARTY